MLDNVGHNRACFYAQSDRKTQFLLYLGLKTVLKRVPS